MTEKEEKLEALRQIKGLRLPVGTPAEMKRESVPDPREGWDEEFKRMAASGDDELLCEDAGPLSGWDESDWAW